ncbi:hypothetical protein GCM10010441_18050 [Kitasatospora paracochleata]|uniref:Uncharacterized protein n=1 Tax=Kitasatospora paracochleata TaxID=58354 RepID=A0ABT1JAC6_9ACTN|nr:hypothetical protein [Kitasatospora paracochleata]MCP2314164.1 hypothetical protein [Kitasatospora paracochleata]
MMILTDGGQDATTASLRFWRDNRHHFGTFIEARAYLSEDDVIVDGRRFANTGSGPQHAWPQSPKLVLIDDAGNELWLTACCAGYGGGGPGGTAEILTEEGFGTEESIARLVTDHLVLVLRKDHDEPVEAVPSAVRGTDRDRRNLDRWLTRLWHEPRIHTDKALRTASRWLRRSDPLDGSPRGVHGAADAA